MVLGTALALSALAYVLYPLISDSGASEQCSSCGAKLEGGAKFCTRCGAAAN